MTWVGPVRACLSRSRPASPAPGLPLPLPGCLSRSRPASPAPGLPLRLPACLSRSRPASPAPGLPLPLPGCLSRSRPASPAPGLQPRSLLSVPFTFPVSRSGALSPPPAPGPSRISPGNPAPSALLYQGKDSRRSVHSGPLQPHTAAAQSRCSAHVGGTRGALEFETVGALFTEHQNEPGRASRRLHSHAGRQEPQSPFHPRGNGGSERASDFPKVSRRQRSCQDVNLGPKPSVLPWRS